MTEVDQDLRLRAAALIKSIADSEPTFDADYADELALLLAPMPLQGTSASFGFKRQGPSTQGEAAGVGSVRVDGEEKSSSWSAGEKTFRCGAYVVEKNAGEEFVIRHVGDVDSISNEGEELKLAKEGGTWRAYLNQPRILQLGPFTLVIGGRWRFWKRAK